MSLDEKREVYWMATRGRGRGRGGGRGRGREEKRSEVKRYNHGSISLQSIFC